MAEFLLLTDKRNSTLLAGCYREDWSFLTIKVFPAAQQADAELYVQWLNGVVDTPIRVNLGMYGRDTC